MMRYNLTSLLLLVSIVFTWQNAYDASDGSLGTTSTGTSTITLTKLDTVQITGMEDVVFGSITSAPSSTSFGVCVYSSTAHYTVTATSANGTGTTFRFRGSPGNYITYNVLWQEDVYTPIDMDNGVASTSLSGASVVQGCFGYDSSYIHIEVDANSFNSAMPGAYADTLTIVITSV